MHFLKNKISSRYTLTIRYLSIIIYFYSTNLYIKKKKYNLAELLFQKKEKLYACFYVLYIVYFKQ